MLPSVPSGLVFAVAEKPCSAINAARTLCKRFAQISPIATSKLSLKQTLRTVNLGSRGQTRVCQIVDCFVDGIGHCTNTLRLVDGVGSGDEICVEMRNGSERIEID